MRICLDLDGVIAQLKKPGQTYPELEPVPGAVEKVTMLRKTGHYIIIQTARHMKTCEGNVGLVQARIAKDTLEWLEKHQIPFDEIFFGKPWAEIYIDDNGFRFEDWSQIGEKGEKLPKWRESQTE